MMGPSIDGFPVYPVNCCLTMVLLNLSVGQSEECTHAMPCQRRTTQDSTNCKKKTMTQTAREHVRGTEVCPVVGGCRGLRGGHCQRSGRLTHSQFGDRGRCQISHWFGWSGNLIFWNLLCIVCREPSRLSFQFSSKPPWLSSLALIHLWEVTMFD